METNEHKIVSNGIGKTKSNATFPVNTTKPEWDMIDFLKLGGQIHKILNETLYRKLTVSEYKKVTKLINSLFKYSQLAGTVKVEELREGVKDFKEFYIIRNTIEGTEESVPYIRKDNVLSLLDELTKK